MYIKPNALNCGSKCKSVLRLGYALDGKGFLSSFLAGEVIFLFFQASTPALGPTRSLFQRVQGTFTPELKRPGIQASHSVSRWVMCGAVPALLHIPSRPAEGWVESVQFGGQIHALIVSRYWYSLNKMGGGEGGRTILDTVAKRKIPKWNSGQPVSVFHFID
jgi:hypothetical protein